MTQYYYLVSSLPFLEFGMKMPISYDYFMSLCEEQLFRDDMEAIKRSSILPSENIKEPCSTLKEWNEFERTLRNELVRHRASRLSKDPGRYFRGDSYIEPFIGGFLQYVITLDSPIEAENSLDRMRWEKLEELTNGHYFDIVHLISYALKLQILNRWEIINSGKGTEVLQGLLSEEKS